MTEDKIAAKEGQGEGCTPTSVDEIAACEKRLIRVDGPVRSGKTEALVRRCVALLAREEAPENILVITSTAMGAAAFRRRLSKTCTATCGNADLARDVPVMTAQDACISVLNSERARTATGRIPRTLASFEYNFLLEDIKTLGTPPRRIRLMLKRLQRQWCALAPESEWLLPGEEQDTLNLIMDELRALGAMLPDEVAWVCARYLQSKTGRADAQRFAFVLCDDFQNLSRAQQTCVCLMAREQLMVAGNAAQAVPCATGNPYPQGFEGFQDLRRNVTAFMLPDAWGNVTATAFADAVAAQGSPKERERHGSARDVTCVKWNTPEDELSGITLHLRRVCDASDEPESSFALVAPNKRWARALAAACEARGLSASTAAFSTLGGDPRDLSRCRALQAYTLLNLIADPNDLVAWRCWCGFGNHLTNSDAWSELVTWAKAENLSLLEALERTSKLLAEGAEEPFLRARALAERWDEGQRARMAFGQRRGFALLQAAGADALPEFADIASALDGDEDAAALFALMREREVNPTFPDDLHTLHITSYAMLTGCTYRHLIACGCVDGLMPARDAFEVVSTEHDRQNILTRDRSSFASGVAKAVESLTLSTFSKADLETAERMKMQVVRVRSEEGARMAMLRPTCFIAEAGANAPTTLGGQALLA